MTYLLDGVVAEYPSWRNYFDFIVTGAGKPGFFAEQQAASWRSTPPREATRCSARPTTLERGKVYQGGNLADFEQHDRLRGRDGALRRRSHLRRHPQVEEDVDVAHLHDRAGDRGRAATTSTRAATRSTSWPTSSSCCARGSTTRSAVTRRSSTGRAAAGARTARAEPSGPAVEEERKQAKAELDRLRKALQGVQRRSADTLEARRRARLQPVLGPAVQGGQRELAASASRSSSTPASTPAGCRTSSTTRRCSTSARRAT